MGRIPESTIEQIRQASDIVEIIGAHVPLKRAGGAFVGLCPFHREKSPSFNVNPQKQFFYCFGCGVGGSVFTFIQKYENIGFLDAVRRLAERARIPLEFDESPGSQQERHIKDQLLLLHEQIAQRWQNALGSEASAQIARDYLAKRRVTEDAVKLFRIGYAPDSWDDTVNWGRGKGFSMELLEQSGLVIHKEGTDRFYDRFRGRLMFPICDEQGRVVAFSGRVLSGDEKTAKYVNSPESPIFKKGRIMFGLDKSNRAIADAKCAVICEGQLDLISCFMAGVKNIVAPQGTAFTSDHARILKRYAEEVVLCFDSDNAGQKAAVRALDLLLASGLAIRVASVPAPHDPDSFIKEFGGPAFQKIIAEARGFFDYYLDRLCLTNDITQDKGRLAVARQMSEALQKTGDPLLIDTHAQKTAIRLGVPVETIRGEFKKTAPAVPVHEEDYSEPPPEETAESEEPMPRPPVQEEWLLRLLLETDDFVEWIDTHLDLEWITHAAARHIISTRLEGHRSQTWPGLATWLSQLENPAMRNLVAQLLADKRPVPDPEAALKGVPGKPGLVQMLRDKHIDRQMAQIKLRLADPSANDAEKQDALVQNQQLREFKRRPLLERGDV